MTPARRLPLAAALLACGLALAAGPVRGQTPFGGGGDGWSVEGVAGLFTADRSPDPADSGPLFQWRYTRPVIEGLRVGGQVQFRDDDPSRGRSQAAGLGATVVAQLGALYVPAGVLVEGVHVEKSAGELAQFPEPEPGLHLRPRAQAGLGAELGTGPVRFLLEGWSSTGFDGTFLAFLAGVRSADGGARRARRERPRFVMHGSGWGPLSGSYEKEEDFRGYGLRYEAPVDAGPLRSLRGSLGIDFLVFTTDRRWSTGAISLLAGGGVPLLRLGDGALAVDAVADAGVLLFAEGGGNRTTYPILSGGLEMSSSSAGVTPVAGITGVVSDAPAGLLSAIRFTLGVGVSL